MICWFLALCFALYGFRAMFSRKPYGIYSSMKAPDSKDITDIKAYNRSVGWLFHGFSFIFILLSFHVHADALTSGTLLAMAFFLGSLLFMVIYETVIAKRYIRQ
jgi:hypothetical protein